MVKQEDRRRYLVLTAAWIITFSVSAVSAFSVLSAAATNPQTGLTNQMGGALWSTAEFSLAYALYQLCLAVVGIGAGRIVDHAGPKKTVLVGIILYAVGWFAAGYCKELWQVYLTFGVLAGSGAGMIYNPTVTSALRWFPDKRGIMSGVLLASAALGPFTFSPVANRIIQSLHSAQAVFRIFGALFLLIMVPAALFLEKAADGYAPAGFHPAGRNGAEIDSTDFDWKQMLRSPFFYIFLFTFISATTAGNMFVGANYSIAQMQIGASASMAALAVSVCALANFFGRLTFGVLVDKIGEIKSLYISMSITVIALFLMMTAGNMAVYLTAVSLIGIAFGGILVLFPPLTGKTFGIKNLGMNYGFVFLGYAGSSFVGPRIAAYYKDSIGVFIGAYRLAIGITLLGVFLVTLFVVVKKLRQNQGTRIADISR